MITHCCNAIYKAIAIEVFNQKLIPCTYNAKYRGYYIDSINHPGGEQINYCLFCGKKLPKELSNEWFYILEKEYGIDDPLFSDQSDKIPASYLSELWWKQLGDENLPILPKEATERKIDDDEELKKFWQEADRQYEENKKNYKGHHCCWETDISIDHSEPGNISPCIYDAKWRGYYLKHVKGKGREQIYFCPRCGKQYPQELSQQWFSILEKEYGLTNPFTPAQKRKIPASFLTDEWWKSRQL